MKQRVASVSRETLQEVLLDSFPSLGLQGMLNEQQQACLLDYVELLTKWNRVYNLTAVRDPLDMLRVHVIDSLTVQLLMRQTLQGGEASSAQTNTRRLLDIGAGAGLPGIVLAILNPDWQVTLVDAVQKKVAFMTQAIAQLKLGNAVAVHGRIEQLVLPAFDAAISRAFSDLELFAKLAVPHLSPSGSLCAMQGKADDRLIPPFGRSVLHRLEVPGLDAQRHLLILDHRRD